jgi:hypothetical protein
MQRLPIIALCLPGEPFVAGAAEEAFDIAIGDVVVPNNVEHCGEG